MATVDIPTGPLITAGSLSAHVHDPVGNVPTNVIRTENPWQVHVQWDLQGPIVPFLGGEWRVEVALERIGPGAEFLRTEPPIPFTSGTLDASFTRRSYDRFVNFAPGDPALGGAPDGAYHVTVMLTYHSGAMPGPLAAVLDLGVVQFFDSRPPVGP